MSIVITDSGLLTPLADTPEKAFKLVLEGTTQIRENSLLKNAALPFSVSSHFEKCWINKLKEKWQDFLPAADINEHTALLMEVVSDTLKKSHTHFETARLGLFLATNRKSENVDEIMESYQCMNSEKTFVDLDKLAESRQHRPLYDFVSKRSEIAAQVLAGHLPNCHLVMVNCDACAAGNIAMINAQRAIEQGQVDVAIVAGVDCMANYISMLYFGLLGALAKSDDALPAHLSRPFDQLRSGFVMGEGAACVILQSEARAKTNNTPILARLKGGAKLAEATKMTSTEPNGSEYARCIEATLRSAKVGTHEIDHINAHGTSTPVNDQCEALALQQVFSDCDMPISITANKSIFGHSLGASSLIEACMSIQVLKQGKVPAIYSEPCRP